MQLRAEELGIPTVPALYQGIISDAAALRADIEELASEPSLCGGQKEGLVVRLTRPFAASELPLAVAKYARKDHVQTDEHWTTQELVRNRLAD